MPKRLSEPPSAPLVTVCIPTWQGQAFIGRTLDCARNQDFEDIHILVSVDRCDDDTAAICRVHAALDSRVEVIEQDRRLGWAGNVNFLLDQVRSEFFFLYFHDDLIDPEYTRVLLEVLRAGPDAASVHCDMQFFGSSEHSVPGAAHEGGVVERLLGLMVGPRKGAPLRSLIRTCALTPAMRLSEGVDGGFNAQIPFLLRLLAAGPALHVPRALYQNWFRREGGVTEGWQRWPLERFIAAQGELAWYCSAVFDDLDIDAGERAVLDFALYLSVMQRVRQIETARKPTVQAEAADVSGGLTQTAPPPAIVDLPARPQNWLLRTHAEVLLASSLHELQHGNRERGFSGLVASVALKPDNSHAVLRLAGLIRENGDPELALALAHRALYLEPSMVAANNFIAALSRSEGD